MDSQHPKAQSTIKKQSFYREQLLAHSHQNLVKPASSSSKPRQTSKKPLKTEAPPDEPQKKTQPQFYPQPDEPVIISLQKKKIHAQSDLVNLQQSLLAKLQPNMSSHRSRRANTGI